jgi:hypothetical protein
VIPSADCTSSKKSESVYTCPRAPFIGRCRDFYIPTTPSGSGNIPSVNAYKNVFFVLHIYKSATSSHSKPGLFGTTTLTLLLRWFVNVFTCDSQTGSPTDSRLRLSLLRWFVNAFARDSRTGSPTDSRTNHLLKFVPLPARGSGLPHVHDSTSSPNHDPRNLRIRESEASQVPGFRKL